VISKPEGSRVLRKRSKRRFWSEGSIGRAIENFTTALISLKKTALPDSVTTSSGLCRSESTFR